MFDNLHFSDNPWIDIPCFMLVFILLIASLLIMVVGAEYSLDKVFPRGSFYSPFIAPVVEESSKFLALTFGFAFGIVYTAIFAIAELWNFIILGIESGKDDVPFYIMRVIAAFTHFIPLGFQIFGFKMYYKYKQGSFLILGYLAAMSFHFLWNVEFGRFVYINILDWHSDWLNYLGQ